MQFYKFKILTSLILITGCGGSSSSSNGNGALPKDSPLIAAIQLNSPAANMRVDLSNRSDILISGVCSNDGVAVDLSVVDPNDVSSSLGSVVCNSQAFSYHANLSNLKLGTSKIVATHTHDASASADIRYVPFQLVSGLTDHGSSSAARPGDASTYNNAQVFDGPISANGRYAFFITDASNLGYALSTKVQILRKDLTNGELIVVSSGLSGFANDHAIGAQTSADGNIVIFQSAATNLTADATDGTVHYFKKDLTTGTITKIADATINSSNIKLPLRISSDGKYVGIQTQKNLYRIDLTSNARDQVDLLADPQPMASYGFSLFDMSSDGMTFAFKTRANGIQLRRMAEASAQQLLNIPANNSYSITLSADAKTLTFFALIQDVDASATPMATPDLFQLNIESGDIQLLTSTDGTAANRVLGTPASAFQGYRNFTVSADGRYVCYLDNPTQYFTPRLDTATRAIRKDVVTHKLEFISSFDEISTPNGMQQSGVFCSADGKTASTLGTGGSGTLINGNLNLTQILVRQFK